MGFGIDSRPFQAQTLTFQETENPKSGPPKLNRYAYACVCKTEDGIAIYCTLRVQCYGTIPLF